VIRAWLALAVLCAGTARGAGPSYSAAGIVNASNYSAGPFAPNSVVSIFGSGLARSTHALADSDMVKCETSAGLCLPVEMNFVRVYVNGYQAPMLYVSDGQINFLIPGNLIPGPAVIQVLSGLYGPEVTVTLVDAAPALFPMAGGYAIAADATGKLLTADAPAHPNDTVVIYVTGLGYTSPNPGQGAIPNSAWPALATVKVALNGTALDPVRIKYAGVTPGSAGLYQINLVLPDAGVDPEIVVSAGSTAGQGGLKLAMR
jgi:uncharacterized protein (TIGR03437 family)